MSNTRVILIGLVVFALNQILEYLLLRFSATDYMALCDWDCPWYASVVQSGYDLAPHAHSRGDAANWAFFPALTMFARGIVSMTSLSAPAALLVTSKLFFLLAIVAFTKFAITWSPRISPWLAAWVAGFQPYALYGNVGYTESMFLCFTCLSLIALKQGRYCRAGAAGAILSAVRPVGVFIIIPVLISGIRRFRSVDKIARSEILLGIALIPVGLSLFMLYLHWLMGDALAFSHVQIAWDRVPANPLLMLRAGVAVDDPLLNLWTWMTMAALAMVVALLIRGEYGLAAFSLVATLIPLSTGLSAMPRYLWWQAPLLLVVTWILSVRPGDIRRWLQRMQGQPESSVAWWDRLRVWMLLLPLSLWGFTVMYLAWFNHEGFVI